MHDDSSDSFSSLSLQTLSECSSRVWSLLLTPPRKRLRIGIAAGNFADLPRWSAGWCANGTEYLRAVRQAGYEAVQGGDTAPRDMDALEFFGTGVVRKPGDAEAFALEWKARGAVAASCIAGFGYESDNEADALVEAVAQAAELAGIPVYIETHRASMTQDVWRCLRLLERHPQLRLNGDFSHWFTGLEMPAMDMDEHLNRLAPVFARTHMLHGRIGDACCMQVKLQGEDDPLVLPFRRMWTEVMRAFSESEEDMRDLWFFPELLGTTYRYARVFEGREESDRWQQASLLAKVAAQCGRESGLDVTFGAESEAAG